MGGREHDKTCDQPLIFILCSGKPVDFRSVKQRLRAKGFISGTWLLVRGTRFIQPSSFLCLLLPFWVALLGAIFSSHCTGGGYMLDRLQQGHMETNKAIVNTFTHT